MREFKVMLQVSSSAVSDDAPEKEAEETQSENAQKDQENSQPRVHMVVDLQGDTRRRFLIRKDIAEETGHPVLDAMKPMNVMIHQMQPMDDSDIWSARLVVMHLLGMAEDKESIRDRLCMLLIGPSMTDELRSEAESMGYALTACIPGLHQGEADGLPRLVIAETDILSDGLCESLVERIGGENGFALMCVDDEDDMPI